MASILSRGREMLARVRAAESVAATYRGPFGPTPIVAVQAETKFEADSGDVIIDVRVVDWIVLAATIPTYPAQGDEILVGDRTYQVVAIGAEPCVRWHDRDGSTYRIHTVEI